MDVKFLISAECRADNIDKKRSAEEIEKMIEKLLDGWCGIKAVASVTGLTYVNEPEGADE